MKIPCPCRRGIFYHNLGEYPGRQAGDEAKPGVPPLRRDGGWEKLPAALMRPNGRAAGIGRYHGCSPRFAGEAGKAVEFHFYVHS